MGDYTTRDILETMVREQEEHIDWLETIKQVVVKNYLSQQIPWQRSFAPVGGTKCTSRRTPERVKKKWPGATVQELRRSEVAQAL